MVLKLPLNPNQPCDLYAGGGWNEEVSSKGNAYWHGQQIEFLIMVLIVCI